MKNSRSDMFFSIILLIFIGLAYRETFNFPRDASLFPRIFLGILAVLTGILLFKSIKNGALKETRNLKRFKEYKAPALISLGLILYALLFDFLGYILSTFLLIVYVIYILGYRDNKIKTVTVAGIGVAVSYTIFKIVLGVRLPEIFFMK